MELMLTDLLLAALTVVVTTLTAAFLKWIKGAKEIREKREADERNMLENAKMLPHMAEGVKSLLRAELVSMHRRYVKDTGKISLSAKEYVQRTYDSYRALGGNDIGQQLYEDMMELPIDNGN